MLNDLYSNLGLNKHYGFNQEYRSSTFSQTTPYPPSSKNTLSTSSFQFTFHAINISKCPEVLRSEDCSPLLMSKRFYGYDYINKFLEFYGILNDEYVRKIKVLYTFKSLKLLHDFWKSQVSFNPNLMHLVQPNNFLCTQNVKRLVFKSGPQQTLWLQSRI